MQRVVSIPEFVKGQLWKFDQRCIEIGHVGKLLVSHKGVVLGEKKPARSKSRLMTIKELQRFLTENRAVLIPDSGA